MRTQSNRVLHRGVSRGVNSSQPEGQSNLQAGTSGDLGAPARLEACELIVGVDFTKSNQWTGRNSFQGRCLHDIEGSPNPYMQVLQLVSSKLLYLDDDSNIPCFGFGDVQSGRNSVFSFCQNNLPVHGFNTLLERYKEIAPMVNMSGPTTFAPLIHEAIHEVHRSEMKLHVLLIIADGQISHECMEETMTAIAQASAFPICIIMVGVGDGPWDEMDKFDEKVPGCTWDNFQFIEFNRIATSEGGTSEQGTNFEDEVLGRIQEHCRNAQWLTQNYDETKVADILGKIRDSKVIDPPQ